MRLGIISCEILSTEIADMLRHTGIRDVFIIIPSGDDGASYMRMMFVSNRFLNVLQSFLNVNLNVNARVIKSSELRRHVRGDNVAILRITEIRAHDRPYLLLKEIEESVYEIKDFVDFIILGYGLCGNSEREIRDALKRMEHNAKIPVYMPSDGEGYFNNCIEIVLGRDKVRRILDEERGTFFMIPAGALTIGEPHVILEGNSKTEETAAVLKILQKHYKQVVKVVYPHYEDEKYSEIVEKFAKKFKLKVREEVASSDAMIRTLEKAILRGRGRADDDITQ